MPIPDTIQDLPPKWAHLCLRVERFLRRELRLQLESKRLLLAVSAGVDSRALLLIFHLLRRRLDLELLAAHLDHGLRPESPREALAVQDFCARLGLACITGRTKARTLARKTGRGLEDAGRLLRYRFLFGLRRKHGCHLVLTAHQANDLAEDVLLRLIRGTGWPALSGMQAFDAASGLVRPLLLTPKEELIEFVRALGVDWEEDPSNADLSFRRNRIRHRIAPLLAEENPSFLSGVEQLWRQGRLDDAFWRQRLQGLRGCERRSASAIYMPGLVLRRLHQAERLRWYKDALERIGPGQVLSSNLFRLDEAWQSGDAAKRIQFPGAKEAEVDRRGITIYTQSGPAAAE
jgi:tRNA(Ile)-lysidine synthase